MNQPTQTKRPKNQTGVNTMDEFYLEAEEQLYAELDRYPTEEEIAKRAQELIENMMATAYDYYKDRKYDD